MMSLGHGRWPDRLAVWSVLKPRRFDSRVAATVLDRAAASDADHVAIGA